MTTESLEAKTPDKDLTRIWMWVRIVCAMALLLIGFNVVSCINAPEERYQKHTALYQKSFTQDGPMDIIALGSSRSGRVFGAQEFEEILKTQTPGEAFVIYEYAKPHRDIAFDYILLKDVLKDRCVGTVLVEFNNANLRRRVHPFFHNIASYSDIFDAYWQDKNYSPLVRIQYALRDSMQKTLSSLYDRTQGEHVVLAGKYDPKATYTWSNGPAKQGQRPMRKANRPPDLPEWNLDDPYEHRQVRYAGRILEAATNAGAKTIFYYLPTIESEPLTPEFLKAFEAKVGAPLMQMYAEDLEAIRSGDGFADYAHMNQTGRLITLAWMAREFELQRARETCATGGQQ